MSVCKILIPPNKPPNLSKHVMVYLSSVRSSNEQQSGMQVLRFNVGSKHHNNTNSLALEINIQNNNYKDLQKVSHFYILVGTHEEEEEE